LIAERFGKVVFSKNGILFQKSLKRFSAWCKVSTFRLEASAFLIEFFAPFDRSVLISADQHQLRRRRDSN
jgi:hypothetical protein